MVLSLSLNFWIFAQCLAFEGFELRVLGLSGLSAKLAQKLLYFKYENCFWFIIFWSRVSHSIKPCNPKPGRDNGIAICGWTAHNFSFFFRRNSRPGVYIPCLKSTARHLFCGINAELLNLRKIFHHHKTRWNQRKLAHFRKPNLIVWFFAFLRTSQ
jgi:hypothetical protein